jgi:diketogulonate reductase-like aldo/keto reductase
MEYHPFILAQNAANGLDALQKKHGITYQAYGPLAPILRLPQDKSPLTPVLDRIAERLSKDTGKSFDAAAVLLLWNIGNGVPIVTTSGNPERIKAIADLDEAPGLSSEDMKAIDEAGKSFHFRYYSVSPP